MNRFFTYGLLFTLIALVSCSHGVSPSDYVHYIENPGNGLLVKQEVNGVTYALQYQPTDYCVMLEKRSFNISSDEFSQLRKRFSGLEHYVFRIDRKTMDSLVNKMGDTATYKKGITEYFDFSIQKDIKLVEGNDTIPCAICQADANTGISRYYAFTLGFPVKNIDNNQQARTFLFRNKILNTGDVKLAIEDKALKNIPVLKMM